MNLSRSRKLAYLILIVILSNDTASFGSRRERVEPAPVFAEFRAHGTCIGFSGIMTLPPNLKSLHKRSTASGLRFYKGKEEVTYYEGVVTVSIFVARKWCKDDLAANAGIHPPGESSLSRDITFTVDVKGDTTVTRLDSIDTQPGKSVWKELQHPISYDIHIPAQAVPLPSHFIISAFKNYEKMTVLDFHL